MTGSHRRPAAALAALLIAGLLPLIAVAVSAPPGRADTVAPRPPSFAAAVHYALPDGDVALEIAQGALDTTHHAANVNDVVVGNLNGNITVFVNHGDGTLAAGVDYGTSGHYVDGVAVADVNGDVKQDVIVTDAGYDTQSVFVFLGHGDGTLAAPYQVSTYDDTESPDYQDAPASLAVADFSGDGKPDLAIGFGPGGANGAHMRVFLNDGSGQFAQLGPDYGVGNTYTTAWRVTAGHVNDDDDDPDLVVGIGGGPHIEDLAFINDGIGGFSQTASLTGADGTGGSNQIAIADFDGDGHSDVAGGFTEGVVVFFGDGDGAFPRTGGFAVGGGGGPTVTADVNGDGNPDLIGGFGGLGVAVGAGDGTFSAVVPFDGGAKRISTGQLTSLARADVASISSEDLTVLLNTGLQGSLLGGPIRPEETYGLGNFCLPCTVTAVAKGIVGALQGFLGDPVNTATGNFSETFVDLAVPGRGNPLAFTRSYNALGAGVDSPVGFGWTEDYNTSLAIDAGSGVATLIQETGSQEVFTPTSGGAYTAAPRVIATLVKNGDGTFTLKRQGRHTLQFSSAGQLTGESDLNGYTTTLAYDTGTHLLSTVTDEAGRHLSFVWSGTHIHTVTDPLGRVVTLAYDGAGNLIDVTDVAGGNTHFTYDAHHRVLTVRDPKQAPGAPGSTGAVTTNVYDAQSRVVTQTDPLGRVTTFDYTSLPHTTKTTDPKGNVTVEAYADGVRTSITKGYGTALAASWFYLYDPATTAVTSTTDPNGHVTSSTYDGRGNKLTTTDSLARTTSATYNSLNEPLTTTDAMGVTTTMTYDAAGNLLTTSTPLAGSMPAQTRVVTNHYGDASHPGDVTSVTDANGKVWHQTLSTNGYVVSKTDPLGNTSSTTYNAIGWPLTSVSPRGNVAGCGCAASFTTTVTYFDSFGDVGTVTDPLGHSSSSTYDADRNRTTSTDGNGNVTHYVYDADNELTRTTRADGTHLDTTYNADATLASQVDGAGKATTYGYDALGRPTSSTDPLGRATTVTYDSVGNRRSLTDPQGRVTNFTYDDANELTSATYSDGTTPNITGINYDADGQRTAMADGTGTSTWTWDSLHRLTQSTNGAGATVGYEYDLKGQLTSLAYPGGIGTVTRAYDDAGRWVGVTDWLGHTTTFNYNPDGFLTSQVYPNGTTATNTPDNAGRLMAISDAPTATPATPFASFTYGRDAVNQLTSAAPTGVPQANESYAYSPLNQLASVNTATYAYDHADNLVQLANGTHQAFDAANQLCATAATPASCGSVPAGATTFSYDAQGNRSTMTPATGPATAFVYDQANRLIDVQGPLAETPAAPGTPSAPLAVTARADTLASVTVTWAPPADHGTSAITGYVITPTGPQAPAPTLVGPTATSARIEGLASHGGYTFTVTAVNDAGSGASATSPVRYAQPTDGQFTPLVPARILDTRDGTGTCGSGVCIKLGTASEVVAVAGQGGVPASGAVAVVMNVTVVNATAPSHLRVAPSDTSDAETTSNLNYVAGQNAVPNLVTVKLGPDGAVKLNNHAGLVDVIFDVVGWYGDGTQPAASRFNSLAPARILDTRDGTGTCTPGSCTTLGTAAKVVAVAGHGGVPAAGASAVVMNVTVVNPTAPSHLRVAPSDTSDAETTSNLNYVGGQNAVPNLVTVKLGPDGAVKLNNHAGTVDVIFDVVGWYAAAGGLTGSDLHPQTPARILDTRDGTGTCTPGSCTTLGTAAKVVAVAGQGGVPASGAVAVVMNVTVVNATAPSHLRVAPSDTSDVETTSNLNYVAGQNAVPNLVTVKLGPDGAVKLNNHAGTVDVIFDVVGWYDDGSDGVTTSPGPAGVTDHTYAYNGDGLRMAKTTSGATTPFTWDVSGGLPLLLSDGANAYVYGPGGALVEQVAGPAVLYHHHDQLGSTRVLTDATGDPVATYTFDAYGVEVAHTGTATTPFGFAGEYTDTESGLVYLRARYYDPATAQFLTRDPSVATTRSTYAYIAGSPLNGADPTGLACEGWAESALCQRALEVCGSSATADECYALGRETIATLDEVNGELWCVAMKLRAAPQGDERDSLLAAQKLLTQAQGELARLYNVLSTQAFPVFGAVAAKNNCTKVWEGGALLVGIVVAVGTGGVLGAAAGTAISVGGTLGASQCQ